jgi:hypothetical protein
LFTREDALADVQKWLSSNGDDLRADPRCFCRHCDNYREDPSAATYHTMFQPRDRGHRLREALLTCGKVRVPVLDVSRAPGDSGIDTVSLYRPECCGLELDESEDPVCEFCGYEAVVGDLCPRDKEDSTLIDVLLYEDVQRGKKKTGEDGKKTAFQKVPLEKAMILADLHERLKEHLSTQLSHYYSYTMEDLAMKIHDYTFDPSTIKFNTDFAAQIQHEFSCNLTCTQFNNSNCEVNVVAFNPRWVEDDEEPGKFKRLIDVHVWFAIGATTSKFKEADSHFHNLVLSKIIEYYKEHLPSLCGDPLLKLRRALVFTDGCKGQYKGRFNFKRIAEYTKTMGVEVHHAFAATAHFKGFHDALGKMISNILKNGDL